VEVYTTIYGNYANCIGRENFVRSNIDIDPGQLVHSISYFLDSKKEHRFIIELYIDQLFLAAAKTFPDDIPTAVANMVVEDTIGEVVVQELVYENRLKALPHLSNDFLTHMVDEALIYVFGFSYSAKTRGKLADKYLVPLLR
jgi:hypothetical protein